MVNELECCGGPLDGQTVRLRPGQYELSVPFPDSLEESRGLRRYAVYSVRKRRLGVRAAGGVPRERLIHVLMYTGEEWRVG